MSAADNAALARTIYDAFSKKDFDRALALTSEDIELVLIPFGQTFHGLSGFKEFMQGFAGPFPDMTLQITNQVANEDQVVTEFIARGTHTGPLMTPAGAVPPTGRTVELTVCEVWRFKNGKLVNLRNYQDAASLMRQLGLIP